MNKKLNTALFMIGATIFNMVLLGVLAVAGGALVLILFKERQQLALLLLILVFLGALVGSFLIYNQVVKFIARKIDMEKYFLPLFKRKPPKKDLG